MKPDDSYRRPYRIVALDLDGTLLDDHGRISAADRDALRRFADGGGIVVLASGRMSASIRPFYALLGIDGPTIGYNGALARESQQMGAGVILETPLPALYADALIDYTREQRLHLNYYLGERLYARGDPALRRFADLYWRQTGSVFHFLPDLAVFKGKEPTKTIIITDPTRPDRPNARHRDELYAMWRERWGSRVTVMRTNPEYLEFYHREASKGNALIAVAAHYSVDPSLTLAFGDNFNDASMLQAAGCGVAVANAREEVKRIADWVSPLTNNQSAVADALGRLVTRA